MFTLRLATAADTPAVNALRRLAYSESRSFDMKDLQLLEVAHDPEGSLVVGAWDGDVLMGCARFTYCETEAEAVSVLDAGDNLLHVTFPTVTTCRACVAKPYRGFGLLPLFCIQGMRIAEALGATCLAGVQVVGTPGQPALTAMGWDLRPIEMQHDVTFMTPRGSVLIGALPAANFGHCMRAVESMFDKTLANVESRVPEFVKESLLAHA